MADTSTRAPAPERSRHQIRVPVHLWQRGERFRERAKRPGIDAPISGVLIEALRLGLAQLEADTDEAPPPETV